MYFLSCDPGKTESKEGSRQEVVHLIETCVRVRIRDNTHYSS